MAPRRRSVVWKFFKVVNEKELQCLLCKVSVYHYGHTTNLLRHLRAKHPAEFNSMEDGQNQQPGQNPNDERQQHIVTNGDQYCSVEVAMEDDSGAIAAVNEAEITYAINGLLSPVEEDEVKQSPQEARDDVAPSTRARSSIWMHYERLDDQKCALCLICMKKIHHHSSTSNLHRHLSKKHPQAFAQLGGIIKKLPSNTIQHSPEKDDLSKSPKTSMAKKESSDTSELTWVADAELRVLERERELIEALRSAQRQEALALEQQRELVEMLRKANAREAASERERIECLRRSQQDESQALGRQRRELEKERAELQAKWAQLHREQEELECLRSAQEADGL
ncbi:zinc finger BED domain-containing protein [Lampris incognitus]|uniref:zinc finger BED domain-containing protein n=1 Tax=Lampris incognitus TaxID=2546036 RepID=UPI0024B547BF|nr:zinc finger BED domain-containing protein [Lampris incognitus]